MYHYDLGHQQFGAEEEKVAMTSSDRSSLIALLQNKPLVAEQTSCLLAPTAAQEGFKPGPREILLCLLKGRKKKSSSLGVNIFTFLEGQPQYFEELLA